MTINSGTPITIEELSARDPAWEEFIGLDLAATHAHQWAWGDVISETFGHQTRRWIARKADGSICGALPITYVKSAIFGRHAVSMPFLNYGGPLGSEVAVRALSDVALRESNQMAFRGIEFRSRAELPIDIEPDFRKVTVLLELPPTKEALLQGFSSKLRSQVRRAAKDGAVVTHGADDLDGFYWVFQRHMRDLGTPVMPRSFFEAALAAFPDSTWISCVRHEGRPIAGSMGFRWRDEFEITWASSLTAYKKMSPNMMLYWGLMSLCIEKQVRTFNFGRTTSGSGPHRFKLQWGGREEPLYWYRLGAADIQGGPRKEQRHFELASRVWRHLPLSIANILGPSIVRGIP